MERFSMEPNEIVIKAITLSLTGIKLSEHEQHELDKWRNSAPENTEFYTQLLEKQDWAKELELLTNFENQVSPKHFNTIIAANSVKGKRIWPALFKIAALLILTFGIGMYVYFKLQEPVTNQRIAGVHEDYRPAVRGGIIRLHNGEEIRLNDLSEDKLRQIGWSIAPDGTLLSTDALNIRNKETTIRAELNQTLRVRLPDGTFVLLNSGTTLRFGADFSHQPFRRVDLTGEAFFEVVRNEKQPFKVISAGQEVSVLGTKFNVKAYDDDPVIETFLEEGKVRINLPDQKSTFLKPSELATLQHNKGTLEVKQQDPNYILAWKEGLFKFENENLADILRELARWYGVKVADETNLPTTHFSGSISRQRSLRQILAFLERSGNIHFEIEDGYIKVLTD